MKIEHIAIYCNDIERMRMFYISMFGAASGVKYTNEKNGFTSYFLSFSDGARLELMHIPHLRQREKERRCTGYAHLALSVGSKEQVDLMTRRLSEAGCPLVSPCRYTGDGYYESCVEDPEGNLIEITV